MIHGLPTGDVIVCVFPFVWECVNAREFTDGFCMLCDVVWWDAWNRAVCDHTVADSGKWVCEITWILIVGFFFV